MKDSDILYFVSKELSGDEPDNSDGISEHKKAKEIVDDVYRKAEQYVEERNSLP